MSAPIVFKRNKSGAKAVQRPRQPSSDAASEDEPGGMEGESLSTVVAKLKKRAKARSRLSFGDEGEDAEAFQVKKSNLSRKLVTGKRTMIVGGVTPSSIDVASLAPRSNGGPTYDAAYLSELKANTPTNRPPASGNVSYDVDMSVDPDDYPMATLNDVPDELEPVIPSESSILASKRERERNRVTVSDEYISLTVVKPDDEYRGPHPESRLVREEDELGECEDEFAEFTSAQERIALGKKSQKLEAEKQQEARKDMIADVDEDDEETMRWEQEQMRRGGHMRDDPTERRTKPTYKAAPIPPAAPIPTIGPVMARITKSLSDLTTSHAQKTSSLESISEERVQIDARQVHLRTVIGKAEAKRSWFAAFREWVETVATFLDEKYPLLENIEKGHISILKERSDMIMSRRRADDADDLAAIFGDLLTPSTDQLKELDELGRVLPKMNPAVLRRERQAAREARRSSRKARLSNLEAEDIDAEDGYSTDSSLPPSDAVDYDTAINGLIADGKKVLSDVQAIAFQDPSQGLGKWFGEWRNQYRDSYTNAWGGMGLVSAWEFWVRLEMLGWNPLEDPRGVDTFAWYTSLYQYSHSAANAEEAKLEADGNLVSAMVSTAVIPRFCKVVDCGAFNPYSSLHMTRLLHLAKELEKFVPSDHVKFQALFKAIQSCFQRDVDEAESLVLRYQALESMRFDPEAIPARQRFLTRRMKIIENILRWREYTGEKFGIGSLIERLITTSALPVAATGWEVGGESCARKIVDLLPPELAPLSITSRLRMT